VQPDTPPQSSSAGIHHARRTLCDIRTAEVPVQLPVSVTMTGWPYSAVRTSLPTRLTTSCATSATDATAGSTSTSACCFRRTSTASRGADAQQVLGRDTPPVAGLADVEHTHQQQAFQTYLAAGVSPFSSLSQEVEPPTKTGRFSTGARGSWRAKMGTASTQSEIRLATCCRSTDRRGQSGTAE
jgi:hypothetical protein